MSFSKSTLEQRENFYKNKFDIDKLRKFLPFKPQFFVIDSGTETNIAKNKKEIGRLLILKPDISYYSLRKKLIEHLPEDVYYDRNIYKNSKKCLGDFDFKESFSSDNFLGQELAFDIDPENIVQSKSLWAFNRDLIIKTSRITLDFYNELRDYFRKVKIVYSGRGFHLHVFDKEAYKLSLKERNELNRKFLKYKIDPWVSYGKIRLMRLPYSLNSLCSRICTPITLNELKNFNPDNKKHLI
jgi:DNA primase catalytic subunit